MRQRNKTCQEIAVEQTFVVDCSRLLSFAVGYIAVNEYSMTMTKSALRASSETARSRTLSLLHCEITLILKQNILLRVHVIIDGMNAKAAVFVCAVIQKQATDITVL